MINHPNRKATATVRKTVPRAAASPRAKPDHDHDYSELLVGARSSFHAAVAGQVRLFSTDAAALWEAYLDALPAGKQRQVHNCHCCRRFIQTYGGLVTIDEDGHTSSVMWAHGMPGIYDQPFRTLLGIVSEARVTGIFLSKAATWGTPETGDWQHLSVVPPAALVYRGLALDPNQATSAVRENVKTVRTALDEFTPKVLDELLRVLRADAMARSEKFVGPMQWLRDLHDRPKGRLGENVLQRAVALAPEGFCHPRSSVMAPLLQSIVEGLPFDQIKVKFEAMMHPLRYQRPQAAPAAGNIKAAEALVEKLGISRSLARRFARPDEVTGIWRPRLAPPQAMGEGVFAAVKAKGFALPVGVDLPPITSTWDKFSRTVLPAAERIELMVPVSGDFVQITTATHPDAPPIMKWDRDEERNPFALYLYHGGSRAEVFSLGPNRWTSVTAIAGHPAMWGSRPMPELAGSMVMLILEGAKDTRTNQGIALFPENLRGELHGARSTIEAFSKTVQFDPLDGPVAAGLLMGKGTLGSRLRAFDGRAWSEYRIDRWD